jgi:DHA2 family multidrug resistance protein
MKATIQKLTDSQYHFFYLLIIYVLGLSSAPTAGGFYILSELGGSTSTNSWGSSLFVLGEIMTKPFTLTIGERIGKLKLLKICLWINLLLNILILLVPSYYGYLVLRFLSGIAVGPLFLVGTSSIGAFGPNRKWLQFFLVLSVLMIIVPVISGAFGAIMAYQFNWRCCFVAFIFYTLALITYCETLFDELETPIQQIEIDYIGLITFALGAGCLGFCLITGLQIDGFRSNSFNIVFVIGILVTSFFIVWNIKQPNPILQFNLVKIPRLAINFIATFILYICYFALISLISLWLHLYVNYSVNWLALSLLSLIVGPILIAIIFYNRLKNMPVIVFPIAFFVLAGVAHYVSKFDAYINFGRILITKLIAGAAFAICLPVIMELLVRNSRSNKETGSSFCLWAVSRVFGTLVGISAFTTVWEKRAYFYYQRLGGELTLFSQKLKLISTQLNWFHFSEKMKAAGLDGALLRQSNVLALDDCFYIMTWILMLSGVGCIIVLMSTRDLHETTVTQDPLKN